MFTGPGEDFILFAGSEDSLKITRKLNYGESELKRGRRTNVMKVHYDITVENTGDRPLPLRLADRVPVSNERDIEVDHLDIEPEVEPDQDGLLAWDVTIPAKSVRHFQLRYVVDYPADLRLQGSAPRTRQQAADPFGFGGGGGGGDQNLDTSALQILNLEAQF